MEPKENPSNRMASSPVVSSMWNQSFRQSAVIPHDAPGCERRVTANPRLPTPLKFQPREADPTGPPQRRHADAGQPTLAFTDESNILRRGPHKSSCFLLHLRWRTCAGDALPFAIRHLYPGVYPSFMGINRPATGVRTFALPPTGGNRRVPKRGYLYVADLVYFPLASPDLRQ